MIPGKKRTAMKRGNDGSKIPVRRRDTDRETRPERPDASTGASTAKFAIRRYDTMSENGTITASVASTFEPSDVIRTVTDDDGNVTGYDGPAIDIDGSMKRMDHYVLARSALAHGDVFGSDVIRNIGRNKGLAENKTSLAAAIAVLEGSTDPDRIAALAGAASDEDELWAELENSLTEAGFGDEIYEIFPATKNSFGPIPVFMTAVVLANYDVSLDGLVRAAHGRKADITGEWSDTYKSGLKVFAP